MGKKIREQFSWKPLHEFPSVIEILFFSLTEQINMNIFCLKMSSKTPISSTQELPTQKNSESSSSCLWIKHFVRNGQELFATWLYFLAGIPGRLLTPHALVLHVRCQPEFGLRGPSLTHNFSMPMCVILGFPRNDTSEGCSLLLSIRKSEWATPCDRGLCFKNAKKV